jgi:hypothetical protein
MDIIRGEELAARFEELIERAAADERIILSHAGKQVALVSFDDLTFLEDVDQRLDETDMKEVERRHSDPTQVPIPFVPTTMSQTAAHGP